MISRNNDNSNSKVQGLVLTIDDEYVIRESIRNYLEDYDYNVVEAENGRKGLEVFKENNPDIVLVDLRMPEMDGLEVMEEVNKISPDTPIIVISGTGLIKDVVQALRLGAWDYILKPIDDMSILLHSVEKTIGQARLIRENRIYQQNLEKLVDERTKELKNTNLELKEMNRKIQIKEKKYRLLFNTLLHGIALYRIEYDKNCFPVNYFFLEINPAFEKMTGIKASQVINKSILEVFPETGPQLLNIFNKSVLKKEFKRVEHYFSDIEKHIDILAYNTEPDQFVTVYADITENKILEAQLRQSQKLEAIGTLAGGIAHDFNNILFIITGYTELAIDINKEGGDISEYLEKSLIAGKRAKGLIEQILTFSRQNKHEIKTVKIKVILKEVYKLLRASLPATIEIKQDIESNATVMADPAQIHQVIMNLCTNASHSMREKGGVLELILKVVDNESEKNIRDDTIQAQCLLLSIKDTGHGIPNHLKDKIFDPFFTTKLHGEGTGMGLSVVHGIVKNCGGTIVLESEEGKGSTFNVYFPSIDYEEDIDICPEKDLRTGSGKILFVDDELSLAEMTGQMLNRLGYEVIIKTDSDDALNYFKKNRDYFDLVITDQTMPKLTGIDLSIAIKKIRSDIPIILCTGFSANIDQDVMKNAGIDYLINKPILKKDLAENIWSVMNKIEY